MTGESTASRPGRHQLAERGLRADVDDAAVVRLLGVVHDPGVVAELVPHLDHDLRGGAADRADRERREQERDRPAEQQPDEDVGVVDPDRRRSRSRRRAAPPRTSRTATSPR